MYVSQPTYSYFKKGCHSQIVDTRPERNCGDQGARIVYSVSTEFAKYRVQAHHNTTAIQ